jgi:NhaP-type Na+/H+ or K+/H+ antiporter
MSSDDVLLGLGLVIVLAVGSQLLAGRLRLPFVSLAVGLTLFEAGLRLSVREIGRDVRRTVGLLVTVGALVTWAGIWGATALLFDDLGDLMPLLIGALLHADLIREDAGLVATTLMGAALANQRRIDVSLRLEFHASAGKSPPVKASDRVIALVGAG